MKDFLQHTNMNTNEKALLESSAHKNGEVTQNVEHAVLKTKMMHSFYIVSFSNKLLFLATIIVNI